MEGSFLPLFLSRPIVISQYQNLYYTTPREKDRKLLSLFSSMGYDEVRAWKKKKKKDEKLLSTQSIRQRGPLGLFERTKNYYRVNRTLEDIANKGIV